MKIKANKILAVLCVIAMLMTMIVPMTMTASAAETEPAATFEFGANGSASHNDGSEATSYTETVDGYTLQITSAVKCYKGARDAKGNSAFKLGTSKLIGSFNLSVPEDVTSVVFHVAKYKANTSKISINGTNYTLTNSSNDGKYDAITVDTTSVKAITFKTVASSYRCMINAIDFYVEADESGCEHIYDEGVVTTEPGCTTLGVKTFTCTLCGDEKTEDISAEHKYGEGIECTVCGEIKPDSELTIEQAIAIGAAKAHNTYTEGKYYVTGLVTEVYNTQYGNMKITDGNGNILTIYGTYSADGSNRYDAMTTKPLVGDVVTIYGIVGQYNSTPQIKNGWATEIIRSSALNAVNAYMQLSYKYTETDEVLSDSQFVFNCAVDAGLASIEGITAYGIAVTAGNMTVYYTSEAASWVAGDEVISVAIGLGDIINDTDKLSTEFTVAAFVEVEGITYTSELDKTYSVAGMIDEYDSMGIEEVAHLYNVLVGYGLI